MCLGGEEIMNFKNNQFSLKNDPKAIYNKLENGFQYAIYSDDDSILNKEIYIYLIVNVGSLMETDEQLGMAHFLEHMAFRGSENFPKGNMIEEMQKIGMDFGAKLNASTSYMHTVFQMELPNADLQNIYKCLLAAKDFSDGLSIEQSEVESERGVILSELRDRNDYKFRLREKCTQFLYGDTILPKKSPIGKKEIIEKTTPEDLRKFYTTWYTPDRIFLAIAGKVGDVAAVETKIKSLFSGLKKCESTKNISIGNFDKHGTFYQFNVERDSPSTLVAVSCLMGKPYEGDSIEYIKNEILRSIVTDIMNARLEELAKAKNFTFTSGSFDFFHDTIFCYEQSSMKLFCENDKWKECLVIAVQEVKKMLEFGFTDEEFEREKNAFEKQISDLIITYAKRKSLQIINGLWLSHITKKYFLSMEDKRDIYSDILKNITKAECENMVKSLWARDNRFVYINSNETEANSEDAIKEIFEKAVASHVEKGKFKKIPKISTKNFGKPGTIISRKYIKDLDFYQIKFFNNVRLNIKNIKKNSNTINVCIRFGGGLLDASKSKDYVNILAESLFIDGGLLTHSSTEIKKILSDKSISVDFSIAEDSFTLNGMSLANENDFNLLMATLCHYIKQPGFRDEAIQEFKAYICKLYRIIEKVPSVKLMNAIHSVVTNDDTRLCFPSFDKINQLGIDDAKDLILDPLRHGTMEITIVGNVSIGDAIKQTAKTFGTLSTRSSEKPSYAAERKIDLNRKACNLQHYFDGEDQKELLSVFWITCHLAEETISECRIFHVIRAIISDRMRVKIRKVFGEAYSPSVANSNSNTFHGFGILKLEISIDPAKFDVVKHIIDKEITDLYKNGVTEDEFFRALEPIVQETKNDLEDEFYWLGTLSISQEKPEVLDWVRQRHDFFRSMTINAVNAIIKKYLKPEDMFCLRMCPKEKKFSE
ncbi:MAG: insulinase family protein [Puniceicoccales bacterium]|nr:insulinase family protein [Puniceicoccales bacterium]